MLNSNQIKAEKLGNTLVFLSSKLKDLSLTKALKLLYLIDEASVQLNGIPFLNLEYQVWENGPVNKEFYQDVRNNNVDSEIFRFIEKQKIGDNTFLRPITEFSDDWFSDNDMFILDEVIFKHGHKTAEQLSELTHRDGSPWSQVVKEQSLDWTASKSSEFEINLKDVAKEDWKKDLYEEFTH